MISSEQGGVSDMAMQLARPYYPNPNIVGSCDKPCFFLLELIKLGIVDVNPTELTEDTDSEGTNLTPAEGEEA